MNFIHRNDHLGSYRRVENGYQFSNWVRNEKAIHDKSIFSWKKTSSVGSTSHKVTIKIGGNDVNNKKRNKFNGTNRIKSTKYTLYSFLPRNLLEQFRRVANFYFLVMTILGLLIDSPVSPLTSLIPLIFVISVTAAKQGYEDYLRHKTDNIVNFSPVTVIRNGELTNINCEDIMLGDIVMVYRDCDVPCDLVLLKSSDVQGKCFITTVNLDGESNLKKLFVPRGLPNVDKSRLHTLGTIVCETPKFDLYSFNGKIILNPNDAQYYSDLEENTLVLPLRTDNLLLRGSRVKSTEFVIGCAVYTGINTKLALNSRLTRNKFSSNENHINKFLIFILCMLIGFATFAYLLKRYYENVIIIKHNYLGPPIDTSKLSTFLNDFLSFVILFNYLIPISLYVTIELTRVLGTFFMEWDQQLYDIDTDQPCIVNTSNLNEELGQINILFSDKTGTLTKNEMIFQSCSINCKKYSYHKSKIREEDGRISIDVTDWNEDQKIFFQALGICHTVQLAKEANQSSSDDDEDIIAQKEQIINVVSFTKIAEETQNGNTIHDKRSVDTQENEQVDEVDHAITKSTFFTRGENPLTLDEKRKNIVKRSPRFTGRKQLILQPLSGTLRIPLKLQSFRNRNKIAPVHRSTSQIDLPVTENNNTSAHRRTLSYGANPNSLQRPVTRTSLARSMSSMEARVSYASPHFILPGVSKSDSRKTGLQHVVEKLDYQAASPDEKALLEGCAHLGLVYMGDDNDIIKLQICPPHLDYSKPYTLVTCKEINFIKLNVIEFTSERKRMSVIVKDVNGDIWIYTKGADNYVLPLCNYSTNGDKIDKTNQHVNEFAHRGLRTLVIARRKLTKEQYNEFKIEFEKANDDLEERKNLIELCYAKIETQLEVLGATAVEDLLQDDLKEALFKLQRAGIKVWVLTGDKVETALNIAISCGHISSHAQKYFILECQDKDSLELYISTFENDLNTNPGQLRALLIDGISLKLALKIMPERFRDIAIRCHSVLCCRLSPLQKCEIVSLVKTNKKFKYITAAIGDGANDVSMIQEAHIGIGIVGKEGRQAARCADFAIAKFNMLPRLVLVHGHYSNSRLSLLVLYFFYKEIVFMGVQLIYQFHSMFSSISIYDSLFMTLYNVVYTALPILYISLTEKNYPEEVLMKTPELYKRNLNNRGLRWSSFLFWQLIGVYHTIVCFYITYYIYKGNNSIFNDGQTGDFSTFGVILIQNVVLVTNFKIWLETTYQSYFFIFIIWLSIAGYMFTTYIYNILNIRLDTDIYYSYNNLLSSLILYLMTILVIFTALLPDFTIRMSKLALKLPKRTIFPGNAKNLIKAKFQRHNIVEPANPVESTYL